MTEPTPRPQPADHQDAAFTAARPRLFAIAYRMLGSRADAEDVLQDAWMRWHQADQSTLQSAEAWLVTVVTRLSIDRLRAAKAEREAYVGWWLPEPLVEPEADTPSPEKAVELAGDLSMALLWVLERLSPEERAAFLMRQVFDQDYAEIAALLGKTEAACRQMVHRASDRVQQDRPRFDVAPDAHRDLLERFAEASRTGQRDAIRALLADDAHLVGDGGGKVPSFMRIIQDAGQITKIYCELVQHMGDDIRYVHVRINGEPGLLRYVDGKLESAQSFVIENGRIVAIYVVRNPDKLAHIGIGA
ncbi:ECF RNA polymerase sigma factor SigJ [Ralstonia mannitolilytica]|jgi:RNA polymerase sigma-70 factor (ECF subfamily)|uniref:RNA polymerase sigma-70 factor n=1 Tax=Ralstonia mannitolilytica TaxID=105219 RepID=UPI0007B0017C|nr:RNA polymerase sigma-70 factor [Ralstonia mannitolilytica]ATG21117.1 RNA polymerase sigma-70 factor [Ralstonia pickettii]ANA33636.1 RNA polymerase subunit sigma-24 [Ralstonia mannitolilytica]CAJ0693685.1 ECF RNA polymerase sigma factor SigJ [Ralstonia mannitolilytica]CAJ0704414.1 ECF RNA polymerase sigma factor SigJ [Ralstonia mannitolilytica]CAJ0741932.1 ECF RNA polymerase sigma factor SigJ [Ralstonia mannitolilytica]